ncbi:hypothetical protein [Paraprevotella xylaniphila]|uniref:Conserved domain protein n=1 Tax=Paraprevotella xylaniphila YIT 11841 TaxID=762982 RepID=F3QSL2_9BACT|nr:hypothetical protein [Paraprevotella xylaniphila]EGG55299.1 conserved domain protein [Paraprevotella xylaniphila YIT 11841]
MANKRIVEDGIKTRFTSERQPPKSGRKPKLYTVAKKAYNVSREEWNEVKLYLLQCTPQEIDTIIGKDDTPMWVLILARGLKRNAAKGVTDVLNDMEDRLFGRAVSSPDSEQTMEHGSISIDKWIKKNSDD